MSPDVSLGRQLRSRAHSPRGRSSPPGTQPSCHPVASPTSSPSVSTLRNREWRGWDARGRSCRPRSVVAHLGRSLGHLEKSESFLPPQFQTELRKILVSLIEVAQKLLALNPDAVELFKKANGMRAARGPDPAFRPHGVPPPRRLCPPHGPVRTPHDPRVSIGSAGSACASRGRGAPAPPTGRGLHVHVLCFRGAWPAGGPLGLRAGGQPSHWPGPHRWPRLSPAAMLDEEEDGRVDEAALRQLTEMGFPETRAAKALRLNQYVRAASFPCCRCCGAPLGRLPPSPSLRLNRVQ